MNKILVDGGQLICQQKVQLINNFRFAFIQNPFVPIIFSEHSRRGKLRLSAQFSLLKLVFFIQNLTYRFFISNDYKLIQALSRLSTTPEPGSGW